MKEIKSKKQLSLLSMISTSLYQLILAAFGFILPNMIMNHYGVELHGYTTTVSNIMSYVSLVNAGLAPVAVQALYNPLANNDKKRINGVLNAISRFYTISGILYTVLVLAIAFILPVFLSDELPSSTIIVLMIVIGATNTLECFIYSKYRVLIQADQRLFIVSLVDMIAYIIRIVIQILLIKNNMSIVFVMGAPILIVLFRTVMLAIYSRIRYGRFDSSEPPIKSALSSRWSAMIHQITGLIVNNTDVLLLSVFGSLVEVSVYSVYNVVFSHLSTLMTNVFNNSIIASFGRVFNEKHENMKATITRIYTLYEYVYYIVTTFIFCTCSFLLIPFVSLYTRKITDVKYVSFLLAVLFIVIGIANNLRIPSLTLIISAGHFKETQSRAIAEAVINIVVSLALIKPLGMYGLLIGTICSYAYRTVDIIVYSQKHFLSGHGRTTFFRLIRVILLVTASILLSYFYGDSIQPSSWSGWVKTAAAIAAVNGVVILLVNVIFEPKNFSQLLKSMLNKKNKAKA